MQEVYIPFLLIMLKQSSSKIRRCMLNSILVTILYIDNECSAQQKFPNTSGDWFYQFFLKVGQFMDYHMALKFTYFTSPSFRD